VKSEKEHISQIIFIHNYLNGGGGLGEFSLGLGLNDIVFYKFSGGSES
jgi:hypothetical protein